MVSFRIPLGEVRSGHGNVSRQARVESRAVLRLAEKIKYRGDKTNFKVNLTLAPVEINYQKLSLAYGEVERPGDKPLLLVRGDQLRQVSFEAIIVSDSKPGLTSCESKLHKIELMAKINADCVFVYGGTSTTRRWRITEFSYSSLKRHPRSDEITQAKAQITLSESTPQRRIVPGMITIKIPDEPRNNTASNDSQGNANDAASSGNTSGDNGPPKDPGYVVDDPQGSGQGK